MTPTFADPAEIENPTTEDKQLARKSADSLTRFLAGKPRKSVSIRIAPDDAVGETISLPLAAFTMLNDILAEMAEGHAVRLMPVRPRSPGLQHWSVTQDEAEQIQSILESPPGSPGRLKGEPRAIPAGDASLLQ